LIYRFLATHHRDAVEKIKAEEIEYEKEDREKGSRIGLSVAQRMDDELRELFADICPIGVNPYPDCDSTVNDIFEKLMSDAVGRCDFERIAEAFLAGLELPPYGNDSDGAADAENQSAEAA
jgi:hypothetical protein